MIIIGMINYHAGSSNTIIHYKNNYSWIVIVNNDK